MAKKQSTAVTAIDVLTTPQRHALGAVTVLAGTDGFLRHEALHQLLVGPDGEELFVDKMDGRRAELRDVLDSLAERSLFGDGRRTVVVEEADAFVKQYRGQLEDYCDRPVRDAHLVLEVQTWPGNTRLAKRVAEMGITVSCHVPASGNEIKSFQKHVKDWLEVAVKREYDVVVERAALDLLLDKLPTEPGLLYQEATKLALLSGDAKCVDGQLVKD
ncbi:MAG: hypothetical protein KDA61_06325, partial [Planctomycetales bacterium]|nr:hypothetical protein [Planctomycetales bacterium]